MGISGFPMGRRCLRGGVSAKKTSPSRPFGPRGGEPRVIFPSLNPLRKRLNGRIGLLGLLKVLLNRREITGLRCLMFGIKDKYRQLGIPMLVFHHIFEVVRQKDKYRSLELGWTLEDNEAVTTPPEA